MPTSTGMTTCLLTRSITAPPRWTAYSPTLAKLASGWDGGMRLALKNSCASWLTPKCRRSKRLEADQEGRRGGVWRPVRKFEVFRISRQIAANSKNFRLIPHVRILFKTIRFLVKILPSRVPEITYTVLLRPRLLRRLAHRVLLRCVPSHVTLDGLKLYLNPCDPVLSVHSPGHLREL